MSRAIAKKIFQKDSKESNMGIKVVHKEICIFKNRKEGMKKRGTKNLRHIEISHEITDTILVLSIIKVNTNELNTPIKGKEWKE